MLDNAPPSPDGELARAILRGAEQIAIYLYGHASARRKIHHLAAWRKLASRPLATAAADAGPRLP